MESNSVILKLENLIADNTRSWLLGLGLMTLITTYRFAKRGRKQKEGIDSNG
jgi:hypothetical protein